MIIVVTRDPDASNEYAVFAEGQPEPRIVTLDYGYADLSNAEEFAEWRESHLEDAAQLIKLGTPNAIAAATFIAEAVAEAAGNYGHDN